MKRDHVTITYYETRYDTYKGYDYLEGAKFKVRKYRKNYKRMIKDYWDEYWDNKYYVYGYWYYLSKPCELPSMPKLKRHVYIHRGTFPQLNSCPKSWNKLMHIRPNRRKWKRWCQKVTIPIYYGPGVIESKYWDSTLFFDWSFDHINHTSEGMPYPSGKKHVYFY